MTLRISFQSMSNGKELEIKDWLIEDCAGCIEAIIAQNALNGERPSTMVLPLESIRLFGTVSQRLKLAEHWESSRRSKRRNRQLLRRLKKGQSLGFLGNLRVDLF